MAIKGGPHGRVVGFHAQWSWDYPIGLNVQFILTTLLKKNKKRPSQIKRQEQKHNKNGGINHAYYNILQRSKQILRNQRKIKEKKRE